MRTFPLHLLARRPLQPFWEGCYRLVVRGMGYNNYAAARNGEHRVLAQVLRECGTDRPIVFDVGANEGDFSAHVLKLAPEAEIHAFEPNPPTFARLSARFAGHDSVHTYGVGVSDQEGTLELADYAEGTGSTHASFSPRGLATIQPTRGTAAAPRLSFVSVPVSTLDRYIAQQPGISQIDYLKLDVEGHESAALVGAPRLLADRLVRNLQLEINAHNAFSGTTLYHFHSLLPDYDPYKILPDGLYPLRYTPFHEVFRYANFLFRKSR